MQNVEATWDIIFQKETTPIEFQEKICIASIQAIYDKNLWNHMRMLYAIPLENKPPQYIQYISTHKGNTEKMRISHGNIWTYWFFTRIN